MAFRFQVAVDDLPTAGFSDVSGIELGCDMETYQEGGLEEKAHARPKPNRQSVLTLKRGLVSRDFYDWFHKSSQGGPVQPRNLSIFGWDPSGSKIEWAFQFFKVYPARWKGPQLAAGSSGVAVETMEVSYGGVVWLQ